MLRWYFEEHSKAKSLQKLIKGIIRKELTDKIDDLKKNGEI
jgi:dephospho-CoA kinase